MKPILIATPRTGSNLIGEQIGSLAKQWWDYKGYLNEFFSVDIQKLSKATIKDGKIFFEQLGFTDKPWCNPDVERRRRLQMIGNDHSYMIKIMPPQYGEVMRNWISKNYDPILLERRDKKAQLLSWMATRTNGIWMHHKVDPKKINQIQYKREWVEDLIENLIAYKQFKINFPKAPVIVYEDWQQLGSDQDALIKLLGLEAKPYAPLAILTKPTPYISDPEELIVNRQEWLNDKPKIIEKLNQI